MANRLASETSPYLKQHADNPVDWYPWGDAAFEEARRRNVPVLLSVGYSACHWCHVMAHESFEDSATAALMNELYVPVKVDREERPDVDAVYMEAVQAMTGRGGWPMTVFLAPDGRPFYGGTYFPPEPRHGMPSFPQVLQAVDDVWRNRRDEVEEQAVGLVDAVRSRTTISAPGDGSTFGPGVLSAGYRLLRENHDDTWGGFGRAPKFPQPSMLDFLLRAYAHNRAPETLEMLETSLDAMASGGIYDHLGGGFSRYSVDAFTSAGARCSRRPWGTCCGTCGPRRAASTPPRTPTPRARRASSTCGTTTTFSRLRDPRAQPWPSGTGSRRQGTSRVPTSCTDRCGATCCGPRRSRRRANASSTSG
jgi:hypothetical protein